MDEVYSCGFADSIGDPMFFYPVTDEEGNEAVVHLREWIDGSELMDYVTINDGERFDFIGVLKNKTFDTAPPNYEFMVHFVSSFFPGTFSWKYPFSVNLVFFVGSLLLVFSITHSLIRNPEIADLASFTCVFFFSLSVCGTGAYTYLRMYGVVSFYALLLTFGIVAVLNKEKNPKLKYYIVCFVSVFFGLFTHTTYIAYAFSLTFFSCILLLFQKRFKTFFALGSTVLGSLIFFLIVYPYVLVNRFGSWMSGENSNSYSYFTRLTFSNMSFFGRSIGFYIPFTFAGLLSFLGIVFLISVICLMTIFLFRKEKWFISFVDRIRPVLKKMQRRASAVKENTKVEVPVLFLASVLYMLIINAVAPVLTQSYSTRYLFAGMQVVLIVFISALFSLWDSEKGIFRKAGVVVLYLVLTMLLLNQKYYFLNQFIFNGPYDKDEELTELLSGQDVMVFGYHYYDFHNQISNLREVRSAYFGKYNDDEINGSIVYPENDFYIMANRACFNDQSSDFSSNILDGVRKSMTTEEFIFDLVSKEDAECEYVRDFYSFDGLYAIYHITPKS